MLKAKPPLVIEGILYTDLVGMLELFYSDKPPFCKGYGIYILPYRQEN